MIIFMEGPDGTGKTNIAEALAEKYLMKVIIRTDASLLIGSGHHKAQVDI